MPSGLRMSGNGPGGSLLCWALLILGSPAQSTDTRGKGDWCYAPTRESTLLEKQAFVAEIGSYAVQAGARWHVPASVITAMAITESGYGTTRLALGSNNIFGFKWPGDAIAKGHRKFVLTCQPDWDPGNIYPAFATRAEAVDFVASRLSLGRNYAPATHAYRSDIQAGRDPQAAALRWLTAVAASYNYRPSAYAAKISRLIRDPVGDGHDSLWRLDANRGARK